MTARERRINVPAYDEMTAASDNTRVESPYRIQQQIESRYKRLSINIRDRVLKLRKEEQLRKEREIREAEEEATRLKREREDEDRRRRNEEYYKKKEAEKLALYEAEKKANEEYASSENKLKEDLYESDYKWWLEDVLKNPDNYSSSTQEIVKRAMHSYKHPNDYLARLDRGIARALFGLKNRAGNVAYNSIDTNGTRYQGEVSLRQHALDAAKVHQNRVGLEEYKLNLQDSQKEFMPNSPEYINIQNNINQIDLLLNDPASKLLDDDYKQNYVLNKSGVLDLMKKTWRNYVSGFTYDQYKNYVAERNYRLDVNQYYDTLVNERNNAQKSHNGADFLYAKVNPYAQRDRKIANTDRTLASYSPKELLSLDRDNTDRRVNELSAEIEAYKNLYVENRQHLADSEKYWQVSEYFKHGVNAHLNDPLSSLGYWGYAIYPMIGSTASSPEQLISTVAQLGSAAGFASTPYTGGIGAGVGVAAGLGAGYYGIKSGFAENTTEAGDKRVDNFKELISKDNSDKIFAELVDRSAHYWKLKGWSEEQINNYLDGEQGKNHAINDYLTGVTKNLVDEQGNPYVFDKNNNPIYTNPITNPTVRNAELYSTQGLNALYDADNARTVVGNLFQTLVSITPTGSMRKAASLYINKAGQRFISKELAEDVVVDEAGRVTAKAAGRESAKEATKKAAGSTYTNGFAKKTLAQSMASGYERGAAIGEMAGFGLGGEIIGGSVGALGNAAVRLGVEKLPVRARNLFRSIEEGAMHKYQDVYDKLLPHGNFGKAAAIYGARMAKTTAASMASEAAEEAVQYLNSKEDYASKYGWNGMSIGDALINDIYQGKRVFNSYGALLGITESDLLNDAEYWSNVLGGFALGGLHTGAIRLAAEGYNAYREIPVHSAIIESAVMNRELDSKDRASNVEFARQAMRKRSNETLEVLDWMEKNDSRREDPVFSKEDYDEKRFAAKTIFALTENKQIRKGLEAKGIAYGTEEYANAIADIYSINRQRQQNIEESKEKDNDINQLWNSPEYRKEADDIVTRMLASSFEEHIGRGTSIMEAGNKAVDAEVARAKAAGENTETSEFKKHLQNIRKEAQEAHAREIDEMYRQTVIGMSHTAHKLQSLIKLRAQHNTISDFFSFLKDKFNINPKRPDAKLIVKNVDDQIEQAKKDLAEFDEDFDVHMSDAAILDYIKTLDIVNAHSDDIERHEIAAAMLLADRVVIDKHAQMFEYGLIKNKDGKLEYNPAAYEAKRQRQKQLNEDLRSGKITIELYATMSQEEQELPAYNEKDVENNPYKKRIQAIIDARKDNEALNWMINDIEEGDGVTKILDTIAEKEHKEDTSEEVKAKARKESETMSFESSMPEEEAESSATSFETKPEKIETAKEKYSRRKAKAEKRYKERKKTLRDMRKRAYATLIPIPTPLLDIANYLITKAEIATYKIAQFAEELSTEAKKRGFDANSFLSGIKFFYIDKLIQAMSNDPSVVENFSSIEEIKAFAFDIVIIPQQPVSGKAIDILERINKDIEAIDNDLSTHYDIIVKEGDSVAVYPNTEATVNARFDTNYLHKETIDKLNAANTSDESFRLALEEEFKNFQQDRIPIEKYVKYRNVDGIISAIANRRWNQEGDQSVVFGKLMRNTVLAIMFGREDLLGQRIVSDPAVYEEFRKQVKNAYNKLTSKENGMGLTIIDCNKAIYGVDHSGNRVSSEADIIATDGNKLYAIDIRYSFLSLREYWNYKYPRATFTIKEHVTRRLKQIEQIINTKFNKGVNGLYCLGVVYDPENDILTIDIENGNYFISVKSDTQDEHVETVEESIATAERAVEEINKNIDEYNILVEEANKYTGDNQKLDNIQVLSFESVQEYVDYLNTLHANYDYLIDKIVDLRTIINQNQNLYSEVWNSTFNPISTQDLPNIGQQYVRLQEICVDLDLVLNQIPSLKVTNEAERQNINKLVEAIFDAQYLLDALLSNPETYNLDLRPEQELIAVALERMAENKDNFGKAASFVRQWWATRFTIGTTDNTDTNVRTESEIFFGYYNKINSWIDTLRNHVLVDILNNYDLQEWYSALLNNYFSKLLDNAEQYVRQNITDFGQVTAINKAIQSGRNLIAEYNSLYDTRPEEGFDGPSISPEVDKINRMPVRWMDKWSMTDSIMPAFDLMNDWRYYYLSISPTFLDSKFELSKRADNTLQLYIEGVDVNGLKKYVTLTFENDLSKAKNNVERWDYVNKARQKFIKKAIAALDFVDTHPGYKVFFDKSTDKGQILYDQEGKLSPVTKFLFANNRNKQDLYTIKLSKENRIGVLVTLKGDNASPDTYSVRGGSSLTEDIGGFDRDYVKQRVHTQSGAIVYFYDTGNGLYIGSPILSSPIGKDDASKLVYLIQKYIDGNRVDQSGFSIMDLLKMRLYMADPERRLSSRNNTNNMITIQGADVTIGNITYNIISNRSELINRIAQMPNVTRAAMMNESLRTSTNSVISRARTLLGQGGQQSIQLSNGLTFDIDDFTHKNNDPNAQDGSTWLGYMLRNNLLGSSANVLGYKELRLSNLRVLPKGFNQQKPIEKEIEQAKQQKPKVVVKADDFFEKLKGLKKVVDRSDIDFNRGTEEQEAFKNSVIEYFDKVLGINGKVEFGTTDLKFFGSVSRNERIAGICTDEMIKLSRFVPMSVAWHEAFHKIFELVIPANERDAFYNAYKSSIYGRFKKPSDRDIAEAFADMFMTYMQNKEAINKADTFFKKAKSWIKSFAFNIGMNFKIGKEKSKEMYALYNKMNEGKYRNTEISLEQHDRFKRLFGDGLYYTVTNIDSKTSADFSHIADVGAKDKLVRSLAYYILKSYEIDGLNPNVARVRITGGTKNMKPTPDRLIEMYDGAVVNYLKSLHPVFEEVFEKVEKEYTTEDGKVVKRNFYPKFEALSRDIADYVGTLFDTMRKPKVEEDDSDDLDTQSQTGEALDYMSRDTDHWDKAAYEFSKLDGLIDEVKVFFGTIPYGKYVDEKDEDGNVVRTVQVDYGRNEFGTPEFMPINEVYQLMVKKFHDITSIEDLDKALEEWSTVKEVYAQVYQKFHELVYGTDGKSGIYKKNENGDYIIAQTNFDRESRALAILSAISSQPLTFLVALSLKQKDEDEEGKSTRIVESSLDRDSKSYPDQWTRYLVSGQIGVFLRERGEGREIDSQGRRKKTVLLFREGMGGKNGTDIFSRTSKFFQDTRNALIGNNSEFEIEGIKYNSNIFDDINRLKDEIVHKLCTIGIMFERDALDYMLSELYGGVDIEALTRFFMDSPASDDPQVQEDAKKQTIVSFIDKLNQFVSDGGIVNQELVENKGYGDIGFINKLAKYQGQYRRMSTLSMALALNGKKLFTISQNNTISHIIKQLNTFDLQNETVNVLSGFGFNVTRNEAGLPIGSIILKAILNRKPIRMDGFTYIGFKTDNKGDQGSEYTEESTVEDYIAKMTMLLQGYLIFPTLADKGTWMLINGVPIPGMKFITRKDEDTDQQVSVVMDAPTVKVYEGKPYLIPNDAVLDQMIEYAKCEMLGIQLCMEDLGYDNIPGYEKQGRHVLTDDEKIANYHTKNGNVEPNGTRFLSLTKIVTNEYDEKAHKYKLVTYNLNDPREKSVDLLKRAQDAFFARREGESIEDMVTRQRETMALTLAIQTQHEVNTAVELGIVNRITYSGKFGDKTNVISSKDESIQNLDSKNLNIAQIKALLSHIMRTTRTKSGELWKDVKDDSRHMFYSRTARSLAIAAILQDATIRHIICSLEVQRCFSGHPALFKVKYGKTSIKDSAYDIQKRIGGMVSTGDDNILGIPGMKSEYTCAECEDYEVGSTSNVANRLESLFSDSQARHVFGLKTGLWDDAYNLSLDELKEKYPERADLISRMQQEGKRYAKAFTGGINVADGSAYITADMCRDMLRMRGAYNNKVREAFKILMSKTKYDWIKSADAYETIYRALNIVPTKYTAYGFRRHTKNGELLSDIAVAYYNKFALFPIFPCMATGKMAGIYDKMDKEGVDMLLMTSAIKVGSQGAVKFDGETISEPFNKYTLSYAYLRRQMGTDPEEKDEQPVGTLMMKIGLANLVAERTYVDEDGNKVTGAQILDDFMGSINTLADIGAEELRLMFFDDDNNLNYEKVSEYLKEQLTARNANKTLIQSILVVTDPVTGNKKLAAPLAATTDAQWIESIFISTMNKKVVDINVPGNSFIQRSVFAMEGDNEMDLKLNNGQKLQMINEEGTMDVVITIDYFKDILPEGLSFEQAKLWLIDQGIISGIKTGESEWSNAKSMMVGYRIPTQAQSSIHALRIVDVLQASKNSIIVPEEFTKITGADFDIDHLYLASYNYKKDENGNLSKDFNKDEKEYYQNKILRNLLTLLRDTENSLNSLYKPIDTDTELITNISDQIPEYGSTKDEPYNFGTLHELVIRKNDYITGKNGIAPFALNSTSHILCRQFKVGFRKSKVVQGTRLLNFDDVLDKDDNFVSSWLSGFINAHVDIVKDPYISRLDVNPFTYNMLNLMIRCGWGDTAVWFLANPLIRAMADANNMADSQYMRKNNGDKTGKTYRQKLIYDSVLKFLDEEEISDEVLDDLLTSKNSIQSRIQIINWLEDNQDKLETAAITGRMDHDTALTVFYAWKILEKYSIALGDLVQHTKVDTRKYGKNFIAVARYYKEYRDLFYPEDPTKSIWDVPSLQRLAENSWIGKKTDYVASLPRQIFGKLTFSANDNFVAAVNDFAERLSYDGRKLYQDDVVNLAKHLQTAIKAKYFTAYARDVLKMEDKDIADLFIGYKSMNRQLVSLKDLISNNPAYKRLETNPFLNQIYSMLEDKPVFANGREMSDRPGFVTVLDNVDDSKLNSDLLSEGWLALMNDEDPRVSKFAKKFVIYAFFSSGEFKGWNKMLKYIPYEWIAGEVDPQYKSYSAWMEDQLNSVSRDYSDLYDDVVANNFMDYRFAAQMEEEDEDGNKNFLNADRGVRIGKGVSHDQLDDVAEYISIRKSGMRSGNQDSYDLFKKVGDVKVGKEYHPIYAKIKKRGYHTRGNDVYEYDWNFNYAENERKGSDTFDYEGAIKRVQEYVKSGALSGFSEANINALTKVYRTPEENQPVAPKAPVIEPGSHIATRGYRKGDPQKHPEFNYVFTENAQAYITSALETNDNHLISNEHYDNIGVPISVDKVKLNVSDVNGTNQAGIRTDAQGNITPNAYGIVVKKYLLDANGKFVAQEGTFKDTEDDFKMFKDLNEDMFYNLEHSANNVTVFPSQMGLGKAALPKRFAEWLRDLLLDRFGVVSEVVKNARNDYEGYGLNILRAEPKESNLNQNREYDWKYEEDSGYSGVLEELGLPEKVRMNGSMTYRPYYDFGRIYLTDNEREYITENVSFVIDGEQYSQDDVNILEELRKSDKLDISSYGENNPDQKLVEYPEELHDIIKNLKWFVYDYDMQYEHDYIAEGTVSERVIKMAEALKPYERLLNLLTTVGENIKLDGWSKDVDINFIDMLYKYMENIKEDLGEFDEFYNIEYSYFDKRQLELFSDEDFDFDPSFAEHCKH